jgi:hypothetical protein
MVQQTVFPFKIDATKETLTAHGGLALMAEFNHGIGLRALTDRYLPMPGSNRGYHPSVMVDSLVLMLEGGGRALEDLRELKAEKGLLKLLGHQEIPEPDTAGDWLRRTGDPKTGALGLKGLDRVRDKINERILRRDAITEYTLDPDATEILGEKAEALFTYNGDKGYMPMVGYLYEAGICIYDEFREGNVAPAFGVKAFYLECKKRMPAGKVIRRYRADSASYHAELFNQLEADGVRFAITADQDKAVKKAIAGIKETEWKEPVRGCGYVLAETVHCMEKFNKEVKIGIGMERMPCGQSWANAVFFRIGIIAYNLFIGFRRLACPESWAKHTIATFRWKMIQVAGRIVKHAGQLVLKLMVDAETVEVFRTIRKKAFELSLCPDA